MIIFTYIFLEKPASSCSCSSLQDLTRSRTDTCVGVVQVLRQSFYLVLLLQSKVADAHSGQDQDIVHVKIPE
jgi:hypothetical protein